MRMIRRVILSAVLLAVTGLAMAAAAWLPPEIMVFYTDFSRQTLAAIANVTGVIPFALWEWLVVIAVLLALYFLFKCRKKILGWLAGCLVALSCGALVFMALWGLNYFAPTPQPLQMQADTYTVQQLQETAMYMAQQAGQAAELVERDENGDMQADFDAWVQIANDGYDVLAQEDAFFAGSHAPVKPLLSGRLFSHMGFTGIFVPFTAESNINTETSAVSLPFTMCHELAHRLTVARENEANFCAFLACIANEDPDFQYSGWYSGFVYTYNALYQADRAAALAVSDSLPPTLRRDINASNAYYAQYDSVVQDAAQKVNDAYLKTVGDENGAESYGKAADFLVAWYVTQAEK